MKRASKEKLLYKVEMTVLLLFIYFIIFLYQFICLKYSWNHDEFVYKFDRHNNIITSNQNYYSLAI